MVWLLTHIYQVPSSFGMSKVGTTQGVMFSLTYPFFNISTRTITCIFISSCSFRFIRQCTLLGRLQSALRSFLCFFSHQHVHHSSTLPYITIGKNKKTTTLLFGRFRSSFHLNWQKDKFKFSNFKGICISMAILDSMPIILPRLHQRRQ